MAWVFIAFHVTAAFCWFTLVRDWYTGKARCERYMQVFMGTLIGLMCLVYGLEKLVDQLEPAHPQGEAITQGEAR